MSFESGRKFGFYASLINIILPIIAIAGGVALIFSIIAASANRIATGSVAPAFSIFGGFIIFIIGILAVGIAGFIMFMYSMYSLSNYYNEPSIFKNVLYAFILSIISGAVILASEFAVIIATIGRISQTSTTSTVVPVIISYVVVIVVALVFGIINGVLYMRAFNKLKEKSGVDNFGTAGILYLVGIIIPLVGWIAWIFAYLGFRQLQPSSTTLPTMSYPTQPPSISMQTKRCPICGTDNYGDASYCRTCGNPLQ